MTEYLYDAIRATSGQEIIITAYITDDEEKLITEDCYLVLYDMTGEIIMARVAGNFLNDFQMWEFRLAADATEGCKGRFWYQISHNEANLCFKQPIYLV